MHRHFPSGPERRTAARHPCHVGTVCQVLEPGSDRAWVAGVWNISRGGISLLLEQRFEPGRTLSLELRNEQRDFFCRLGFEVRYSGICFPNGAWLHGCAFDRELRETELRALI
jgi:hypothetical protein